jgi:hypothetical protein
MGKKKTEKKMTASELALRGGKATLKKHGPEHYRKMVEKRWRNVRKANKLSPK